MQKIQFGASDQHVSRIGLGLAALGRPGYINLGHATDLGKNYDVAEMQAHTHHMLDRARELGINYFDVAQSYGKAEEFLSTWLMNHPDEEVVVGSKWGYYYTAEWSVKAEKHEIKEHTMDRLMLQWPESKMRLDPKLKLYQIHSATFESGVLDNIQVLEKLESIRAQGYIIGLSLSSTQQAEVLRKALDVIVGDQPLFGAVQATYNCLEQSAGVALHMAHDQGLGVIIKEGVANGRLTGRNEGAEYFKVLKQIADTHQVGVDALCLAYILAQPFVHVVLSGAAVADHLISNAQAVVVSLSSAQLRTMDQLRMRPEQYWSERSALDWN